MQQSESLIRELATYAAAKRGAEQRLAWAENYPQIRLRRAGIFFEVLRERGEEIALLPVYEQALAHHRARWHAVRKSVAVGRDGHVYMEIPLAGELPIEALKTMIDEAYDIFWKKLDAHGRTMIELADRPYDERQLLDTLIELHDLGGRREAILDVGRDAILLRTTRTTDADLALGTSKIGGNPDLPAAAVWPTYQNGRPLVFLAQLDLAAIAAIGSPIDGFPANGLLSLFSVWGWLMDDRTYPQIPNDGTEINQEELGWSVALYAPPSVPLESRKTPTEALPLSESALIPTPILSLPKSRHEPPLAALELSDDEYDRFDRMQGDFLACQSIHWFDSDIPYRHHLLGGYAIFQQSYPEEVLLKNLAFLLQIGTDDVAELSWEDGGDLTFYADAAALADGRFERIWGTCQGG